MILTPAYTCGFEHEAYMAQNSPQDEREQQSKAPSRNARSKALAVAILAAFILIIVWAWQRGWFDFFSDLARLRAYVLSLGIWAPLAIIVLNMGQVILSPMPGHALNMVSGFLFGPWLGTLYTLAGVLCGSLIGLGMVRKAGRPLLERLMGRHQLERFDHYIEQRGALFLFVIFLLPFMPDDVACLAAGLTKLPIYQIILLQLLGRAPGLFVANLIGAQAADLSPWQWAVFGVVILLLALLFWRFQAPLEDGLFRLAKFLSRRPNESR